MSNYRWHRYTVTKSFDRIRSGGNPWVSHGDFIDDYRRSALEDRLELVTEAPHKVNTMEERQWGALFAASVEALCIQDGIEPPVWTRASKYTLPVPWYPEAKSKDMRRFLRETTPSVFAKRNVFAGDDVLSRV